MSKSYSSFISAKPSTHVGLGVIPGREAEMVQNHDGAAVFDIGHWKQLDRFLILGAAAPTYYASRKELVLDNVDAIKACIKEDGARVVNRIVEISDAGRAPKNDPALFVLALVTALGDEKAKKAAYDNLNKVARTGTHLFHFAQYCSDLRGWGRGLMRAVGRWFVSRKPENLAQQVVKYKQRDGWSMADVVRVSHPKQYHKLNPQQHAILHYVTKGWESVGETPHPDPALRVIWAAEKAKSVKEGKEIAKFVRDYNLPWEALDTSWLNNHDVWDALLEGVKPEALMRNLGRLTANGFLTPMSARVQKVVAKLTDKDAIVAARLHPLKVLVALKTYQQGKGDKGSLTWSPLPQVVSALDSAFYMAFDAVVPANKNTLLAIDVSGSMDGGYGFGGNIAGMPISPREGAAAMAMVTARCEPQHHFVGFSHDLVELKINNRMSLNDVVRYMQQVPMGSTNISAPFHWARQHKIPVDTFVVLTDNEVNTYYYGQTGHPSLALQEYRKVMKIDAKLVVVGMTATKFSVADPKDAGMLDVVGFDTAAPQIISDFSAGRI